jgi:hypothetical protein
VSVVRVCSLFVSVVRVCSLFVSVAQFLIYSFL